MNVVGKIIGEKVKKGKGAKLKSKVYDKGVAETPKAVVKNIL